MKDSEVVKKSSEEAAPEQAQLPHEKKEEERQFWLDTKYPDESGDSNRWSLFLLKGARIWN